MKTGAVLLALVLPVLAAAAAEPPAAVARTWEIVMGGAVLGTEASESTPGSLTGSGTVTAQGVTVETSYQLAFDGSGTVSSYLVTVKLPGVSAEVKGTTAAGSLTLTATQNGAAAGTKTFAISPSTVILDNNVIGEYRQLSRLLPPDGTGPVSIQMLIPLALTSIPLQATRQEGSWTWKAGERAGSAVKWSLAGGGLAIDVYQDAATREILEADIPQGNVVCRLQGCTLAPKAR